MSWGSELWDQFENVSNHTQKGIEFLHNYGSFVKERCAIEMEYAYKLRKLVKAYQYKKKDEDELQYSYIGAFVQLLLEVQDLAGQHEVIAENMTTHIVKEIGLMVKELREERKRHLTDAHKHTTSLQISLHYLDKSKRAYEKAHKEAEKAEVNFQKVDEDLNLSRAEVEKARLYSNNKTHLFEDSKTEYANQLQKTNEAQRQYYNDLMPKVFIHLQEMDVRRITCFREYLRQSASFHRDVFPIINKCLDGVVSASDQINPEADCGLVIERFKSGNVPPEDLPFEDLSEARRPLSEVSSEPSMINLKKSNSMNKGTISKGLGKRLRKVFNSKPGMNDDSKDDYADYPPVQRRKKIQAKIDAIQAQIVKKTNERDGLNKMKGAYEQNPSMGDPGSLDGKLIENGQEMEKLQADLRKFQGYLGELNGKIVVLGAGGLSPGSHRKDSSARNSNSSEEKMSRTPSATSVPDSLNIPDNGRELAGGYRSGSPSSQSNTLCNNHTEQSSTATLSPARTNDLEEPVRNGPAPSPNLTEGILHAIKNMKAMDDEGPEVEARELPEPEPDLDLLPALGIAKALYPFQAQSEGSIGMEEGEEFELIELDQGDGWTRVRRKDFEEGFVPTTYVEIIFFQDQ